MVGLVYDIDMKPSMRGECGSTSGLNDGPLGLPETEDLVAAVGAVIGTRRGCDEAWSILPTA